MYGLIFKEYSYMIFLVFVGPNRIFDHSDISHAKHIVWLDFGTILMISKLINTVFVEVDHPVRRKLFGNRELRQYFSLWYLVLSDVDPVAVVCFIFLPVDEQEYLVFKLVNSAGVDTRIDKAQLTEKEIGYLEAMAHIPLFLYFDQDNDIVKLSNKAHELATNACIQEHGGNLTVEMDGVVDGEGFQAYSNEVDHIFLDEDPLVLSYREPINKVNIPYIILYLDILHYLALVADKIDFIPSKSHDHLLLLQVGDAKQEQIF